jgi:hypothetical protein
LVSFSVNVSPCCILYCASWSCTTLKYFSHRLLAIGESLD